MPKDESEIGSLWLKDGPKGTYMTGEVLGQRVVCFQNKSTNPKAPQWRVLKAKPKADPADQRTPLDTEDDAIPF